MKNSKKIITVTHGCWTYSATITETGDIENITCLNQGKPHELDSDELFEVEGLLLLRFLDSA